MGLFSGPRPPEGRHHDVDAEQFGLFFPPQDRRVDDDGRASRLGRRAARRSGERRSTVSGVTPVSMQGFNFAALTMPEVTPTAATQSVAIRTSIDLICSLVSELPIHVYRGEGHDRQQLALPRNLQDPGDTGQGLEDWIYSLVQSWLYRGNAYGRVVDRLANGDPARVELFHPDDVTVTLDAGRPVWFVNGAPAPDQSAILHRRANPVAGRLLGLSPIAEHATQIGATLAAAKFGNQWFRDGAHPTAMLVNTEAQINAEQADVIKQRWMGLFRGSREPAVLGRGWEYKPISVTAEESQFLATMRYSETQCARIFGPGVAEILGYETGHSLTYTTVVDRRSDLLAFSLNKWLRRCERLLTGMIPRPQYVRFDRDALLESATLARYEAHAKAIQNGFRTINEIRDDEDMPPVPWGDEPYGAGAKTEPAKGVNLDGVTAGD